MRLTLLRVVPALVLLGWFATATLGQVSISVEVTSAGGGQFHYVYTVTNTSPADLAIVSLVVPADTSAVTGPTAPAGFRVSFDSGLGFLDFIEATLSFAPGLTVTSFTFNSPLSPGPSEFTALSVNGATITGSTTAPVKPLVCAYFATPDFDHDCDVDGDDLQAFVACVSGPNLPRATGCDHQDLDHDSDVDQEDYGIFQRCLSGTHVLADPDCG